MKESLIIDRICLQHEKAAEKPLKYTHLDIAGSAGDLPENPTAAPILALAKRFLENEFQNNLTADSEAKSPEKW